MVQKVNQYAKSESIERAITDSYLGWNEYTSQNPERMFKGISLLNKSLDLSRRLGDPETFYLTAALWLACFQAPQFEREYYALAEELFEKINEEMSFYNRYMLVIYLHTAYLIWGYSKRLEQITAYTNDWAEKTGQIYWVQLSLTFRSFQATMDGKFEEAINLSQRMDDISRDSEFVSTARIYSYRSGSNPRLYLGETEIVAKEGLNNIIRPNDPIKAFFLSLLGKKTEVNEILDQFLQTCKNISVQKDLSWPTDIHLLRTAVITGHKKMAERVISRYEKSNHRINTNIFTTIISRHLGAGAAMLGRFDEAKAYYLKAIEIAEDMRFRPELALARFQLAELLLEHYPDEKEDALAHLNFAIDEFEEMKMQPSLEKAEELIKKI